MKISIKSWSAFIDHHNWHLVEFLFIFDPILQLKALENSSKFDRVPKILNFSGLWVSLAIWLAIDSGFGLEHQIFENNSFVLKFLFSNSYWYTII
jgi:hypothetical protein